MATTFDVARVRGSYPALADGHAYLDGAAGTQVPVTVIDAIADAVQDERVVASLRAAGLDAKLMDSAEVTRLLQDQIVRWADIVKDANIRVTGQ